MTLLDKVTYYKDSAYINEEDLKEYAEEKGIETADAFTELEQELLDYEFIEEENDGRMIFHKLK